MKQSTDKMIAVTDLKMPNKARQTLCGYGYKTVSLPPSLSLQEGVSTHPDMLIFILGKYLVTSKNYYAQNKSIIDEILNGGFELVISKKEPLEKYPEDVLFNAAVVGKYLVANTFFAAEEILDLADKNNLTVINIKQGYAKCSLCVVSGDAVITSDTGIYNTLTEKTDLDVLKIREGFIRLSGYSYGFIGGASGQDCKNVYFCGDLLTHPDGTKIADFCKKHGKNPVSLCDGELRDVGTVFLF